AAPDLCRFGRARGTQCDAQLARTAGRGAGRIRRRFADTGGRMTAFSFPPSDPQRYVAAIRAKGLRIYDPIAVGDPQFWIPAPELQALLDEGLRGLSVDGLPNRTRSKVVKQAICEVLGYAVPSSFKRTRPRFPGQMFDTYTQKNRNLQVWNEGLAGSRRYVV